MKNFIKIVAIVLIIIFVLIALLVIKVIKDQKIQRQDQEAMVKIDEELIGKRIVIERQNKESVDVNVYTHESNERIPLVINIHGGAFIAGDADTLDTQSERISKSWNVNVATINYKLLSDSYDKEYVIDEIKDTVKYFIENADKYHVDTDNIFILGYSAGGYYAMSSALELSLENINIKGQILCYAFLSDILEKYDAVTDEQKSSIPSALFILAGNDPIGQGSLDYEKSLSSDGISTDIKVYENVLHGFIEENNPEYEKLHKKNKTSKSPEAELVAREAEDYIKNWIESVK